VIVDIGPATTDIAILDAAIRVTGGLNIGGNTLTLDIAKKLNVPLETAHQFKVLNGLNTGPRQEKITEALKPSLQRIIGEIQKVIRYYTDRFPDESRLEQVLIVGSGSSVPGLGEYFTGELTLPARVASPWQSLNFNNLAPPAKQLRPRFMTAAGLSLVRAEEIWHD
ncbi:MAG: pilus assembly protein PilM, partial [Candidatus Nanogingivalaceae bacterium]|nr:pilus assembly protein PilM [Candidatus Nanogingivalaceae bacterium]